MHSGRRKRKTNPLFEVGYLLKAIPHRAHILDRAKLLLHPNDFHFAPPLMGYFTISTELTRQATLSCVGSARLLARENCSMPM